MSAWRPVRVLARSWPCSSVTCQRGRSAPSTVRRAAAVESAVVDPVSRSRASWFSIATTVALTGARVCGEATWVPPVRSIAPMSAPVSGS